VTSTVVGGGVVVGSVGGGGSVGIGVVDVVEGEVGAVVAVVAAAVVGSGVVGAVVEAVEPGAGTVSAANVDGVVVGDVRCVENGVVPDRGLVVAEPDPPTVALDVDEIGAVVAVTDSADDPVVAAVLAGALDGNDDELSAEVVVGSSLVDTATTDRRPSPWCGTAPRNGSATATAQQTTMRRRVQTREGTSNRLMQNHLPAPGGGYSTLSRCERLRSSSNAYDDLDKKV